MIPIVLPEQFDGFIEMMNWWEEQVLGGNQGLYFRIG